MAQDPNEPLIPGLIGNFNIPKAVIENKVDVLTFLELMVRKGIVTAQELDEIRAAVVAHLNAAYPALELSYTTPEAAASAKAAPAPAAAPQSIPVSGNSLAAQAMTAPMPNQPGSAPAAAAPAAAPAAPKANPLESQPAKGPDKPLWVAAPPPKFIK